MAPKQPKTPDADDGPDPVTPPADLGVPVEDVDPEPDEELGGDAVQLVGTGWIRFVIGDTRIRFRPPRFGELRAIMEAHEDMLLDNQDRTDRGQVEAAKADTEIAALEKDPEASEAVKMERRVVLLRESRAGARAIVKHTEQARLDWWRVVHNNLGVKDEPMPDDADLPVWLLNPVLMGTVLQHWRSVPLGRGQKPS